MKRDAIYLDVAQRQRAVEEILRSFQKRAIEIKALCVDEVHLHALARVLDHNPRHHMGVAKRECSHYMKVDGLAPVGGLWAVRCECVPIADEPHFLNVDDYILDHEDHGAAIWPARVIDPSYSTNPMADFNPDDLLLE